MTTTDTSPSLRGATVQQLLDELARRQGLRPYTGIPALTARTLVGMYGNDDRGDDRAQAVLAVAREAEVAVAYLNREVIEAHLRATFTDAQWARVAEWLADYDEFLDNSGASESIHYFMDSYLLERTGLGTDLDERCQTVIVEKPGR